MCCKNYIFQILFLGGALDHNPSAPLVPVPSTTTVITLMIEYLTFCIISDNNYDNNMNESLGFYFALFIYNLLMTY